MNTTLLSSESAIPTSEFSGNRRRHEKQLTALIKLGNPQILTEHLAEDAESICRSLFPQYPKEVAEEIKYYASLLTELVCRTGVEAGLPEAAACAVKKGSLALIRSATDLEGLRLNVHDMLTRFCVEVYRSKIKDFSPSVSRCCEYIHENIHNAISLSELSQICCRSPHYVSDLFRKETGVGALQYAHQIKLQYAKYLLEYSELGIAELAASLSYPSHSNFSQRFKKTYGITPQEYRMLSR